jgi:UrcA family protein
MKEFCTMSKAMLAQILAISALASVFAASAATAQDYNDYPPRPTARPADEVIVIAPRGRHYDSSHRSDIGAPIETVSLSRPVRFDDLDLSTRWGAQRLRERVRYAAQQMCRRLDTEYPVNAADEPRDAFGSGNCYRDAVADGMDQADQAIEQAQSD